MKPYVGLVGLGTQHDLMGAATDFYNAGFCTISDNLLSHDPAIIFDYTAENISEESQLEEFSKNVDYAKTMISTMKFGIRYRLPRKYSFPDEKFLGALIDQLPGIDFFEFSHMYPSRSMVSDLQESFPELNIVSHVSASSALKGMLLKYFDKTPYSHHVFDTEENGFGGITSHAKKAIANEESVGFAAKLDESDSLTGLCDIVNSKGKLFSFEARCIKNKSTDHTHSRKASQNFIFSAAKYLLH